MKASTIALTVICAIVAVSTVVGFLARLHRKMDFEQWTVARRSFGVVLVWLLMAGEIYTTYTLLGLSGWTYSKGGPVLYILGVQPLAYVFSFFILPQVWEVGQKYRCQTQADVFQTRYGNVYLSALVALVGVISLLPYAQVQLTGLGIIVEVSSFGETHRTPAMVVAFSLVAAFVFASGVRGVAWVSVIKDLLLLFTAVFVGVAVPHMYFGGIGPMFGTQSLIISSCLEPRRISGTGGTSQLCC